MSEEIMVNPGQLLLKAIESKIGIEQLERLMDLQERWDKKQAEKAFNSAMTAFQSEKPSILKRKSVAHNGVYKYSFASLPKIQKEIDPVLSRHGLSYSFKQDGFEDKIKITCVIKHVLGHSEETSLTSSPDQSGGKNSIQSIGSAVSYLMRYTLKNALGLSEDDDDGINSQLTPEEIDQMALEKLIELKEKKKKLADETTIARVNQIIDNKESASYKKAIKALEKL